MLCYENKTNACFFNIGELKWPAQHSTSQPAEKVKDKMACPTSLIAPHSSAETGDTKMDFMRP